MKAKKIMSVILTFTLIITCFASMSVINVSAHQNYSASTDFTGVSLEKDSSSYSIPDSNSTIGGIVVDYGKRYLCTGTAKDGKYGNSLCIFLDKTQTATIKPTWSFDNSLTNSIEFKSSIYFEKPADMTTTEYPTRYINFVDGILPVLFADNGQIAIFNSGFDADYYYDKWYDITAEYNMNTGFRSVVVKCDGEIVAQKSDNSAPISTNGIKDIEFVHSTGMDYDMVTYLDNISVKTVNRLGSANTSVAEYEAMDFENLKDQVSGQIPEGLSDRFTYSIGGNGFNAIPIVKAVKTDKGTSAYVCPVYDPATVPNGYSSAHYANAPFEINVGGMSTLHFKASVKMENMDLFGIKLNENGWSLSPASDLICFYFNTWIFGEQCTPTQNPSTGWFYDKWYDIDLMLDTNTGMYDLSVMDTTTPDATPIKRSGINESLKTPINLITFTFPNDIDDNTEAYYIDDLYIAPLTAKDISKYSAYSYNFDDGVYPPNYVVKYNDESVYEPASTKAFEIKSTSASAANASILLPFDKVLNSGYIYTADVCFSDFNSARTFKYGNEAFATVNTSGLLEMGGNSVQLNANETYKLTFDATNSGTSTAVVSLADVSTTVATNPYICITQDAADSTMTLDNVNYNAKLPLALNSESVFEDAEVNDDIVIEFTTPLAESVTADNFTVYSPKGVINEESKLDANVTFSADRRTVTLKFKKEGLTHYHIAFNVTDAFGQNLSDYIEVDTAMAAEISDISLTSDGNTITASFTSTKNTGRVFYAIAIYNDNELINVVPSTITLSSSDVNKEYTVSITAPSDGLTYKVKAFRWDVETISPFEDANAPEMTFTTVKNN